MPKYHVEFDVETKGPWRRESSERTGMQYANRLDSAFGDRGWSLGVPADAVITEITPAAVAGWYLRNEEGVLDVLHWTAKEIEEYPASAFHQNFTRMKDPETWVEEPEGKYKDGYYRMDDGYLYRREAGKWSLQWKNSLDWDESFYDDDTIEEDCSVQYLGVDAP
jgi:hypothetical protein